MTIDTDKIAPVIKIESSPMIDVKCQVCGETFSAMTVRSRFCPPCQRIRLIKMQQDYRKMAKEKKKAAQIPVKTKTVGTGQWRKMTRTRKYNERKRFFRFSDAEVEAGAMEPYLDPERTRTEIRR